MTCGGLCPGLNNVIRQIVLDLYQLYGVETVYGVRCVTLCVHVCVRMLVVCVAASACVVPLT